VAARGQIVNTPALGQKVPPSFVAGGDGAAQQADLSAARILELLQEKISLESTEFFSCKSALQKPPPLKA
jgi:hypothetical protein